MSEAVDLLVAGAAELATPEGNTPRGGELLGQIRVVPRGAVAIRGDTIVGAGPEHELRARFEPAREIDARGGLLVPGFVDAHTHPVFDGTREGEFEQRTRGATYVEISRGGGGILSSVRGVRSRSRDELIAGLIPRLDRFLELGTTTVEAKSGYGLSVEDEVNCLEVIRAANEAHPLELVPTFLGAHDYPEEYRESRGGYVELLTEEMLPRVRELDLAEYCDIFTEAHVFDIEASRKILERAKDLGFALRLHVEQLSNMGGAELAAELGAASADHLEFVSPRGIAALAEAEVIPVLCPLVPLVLRVEQEVPARELVRAGLAPAIATDFNPGSCHLQSMPEVLTFASLRYSFTAAEALTAATLNPACSLGRGGRLGSLETGKQADLLVLDYPGHQHLCYQFGRNPVRTVVKSGRVILERESRRFGR